MDLTHLKPNPDNLLDLIVPAYNNPDITARCLAALTLYKTPSTRIIYVNNGSEDPRMADLAGFVTARGGLYIHVEKNAGPYRAVNLGLAAGKSLLVGVVCNDVVVLPNTIDALIAALRPELGIPVVGAVEVPGLGEWSFVDTVMAVNNNRTAYGNNLSPQQGFFSCFVGFRSVFDDEAVGGFDERFRVTFGDADWEERYKDAGLVYGKVHNAPVYHGISTTRKRLGLEADVRTDFLDHEAFKDKWRGRPDVLARHGGSPPFEARKRGTASVFARGER